MIVSGEASGDLHGAKLAEALWAADDQLSLFGIGGAKMRAAGVRVAVDARQLAVVGITEIVVKLPGILRGWRTACRLLVDCRPDLLILIDFPDFNLRLARYAKRRQIKILYYISPQIWAWRRRRVRQIRALVDHMAVILPFEAAFYRRHGVPVSFVGHPLLDQAIQATPAQGRRPPDRRPIVGLLPGSRDSEVQRLLPPLLGAAALLQRRMAVRFLLSRADSVDPHLVDGILRRHGDGLSLEICDGDPTRVYQTSDLVITASGTATLEAALHVAPMIIVYRVSFLSYQLGKALIRVPHIGLVNLIAGRRIVPELIQQAVSSATIANQAFDLLRHPAERARMRSDLAAVRQRLGTAGASARVARIALDLVAPFTARGTAGRPQGTSDPCS